ncbi:MAG: flagellar export chaperone FlgN [Pseudomonadota bacterium]
MSIRSQELLLAWSQECIDLAEKLFKVVEKERTGLIAFDIEKITSSTIEKTALVNQLKEKRESLKRLAQVRFGKSLSDVESELDSDSVEKWRAQESKWRTSWLNLSSKCESNQGLLKHSLKNIDLLLSNLKTLFGNPGVYNQSGKRQDLSTSGKVLEGRF